LDLLYSDPVVRGVRLATRIGRRMAFAPNRPPRPSSAAGLGCLLSVVYAYRTICRFQSGVDGRRVYNKEEDKEKSRRRSRRKGRRRSKSRRRGRTRRRRIRRGRARTRTRVGGEGGVVEIREEETERR